MRVIATVVAVALLLARPAGHLSGQESGQPLSPPTRPQLSARSIGIAGLVLTATLLADRGVRRQVLRFRTGATGAAARIGNGFGDPGYVLPALGAGFLAGRLAGSPGVSRAARRAGEAALLAGGTALAVKHALGRRRPSGDGDPDEFHPFSGWSSFPSGHTTVAFAVATALAAETPDGWTDAAFYGMAGLTAFARLNDDRHWLSDVVAGALIGHFSARWAGGQPPIRLGTGVVALSLEF